MSSCNLATTGAGVYTGFSVGDGGDSRSSGLTPYPVSRTRSWSLPQCLRTVGRLDSDAEDRPIDEATATESYLNFFFFTPLSLTNDPSTKAFAAAVAKSSSTEA